jgi:DNA (cytosine-5)-methyltransferase 1
VKEAARLQSFPSWFRFIGTHTSQMNQVGNAVPPMLALMLAKAVKKALRTTPKLAHEQTVRV